jgi:hypothetical protein
VAVANRSSSGVSLGTRVNTTVTAPVGIVNNDVLLLVWIGGLAASPTPTPPTGFTTVGGGFPTDHTDGTFHIKTYAWVKVAAGESGNYTVTHASCASAAYLGAYSGANTSTPILVTPTTNISLGTTTTATGLTTAVDGSMIVFVDVGWGDFAVDLVPPAGTTPTFTERFEDTGHELYVADGSLATAGATGSKAHTNNNQSGSPWMGSLIAIAAAVSGPSGSPVTPLVHRVSQVAA